MFSRSRRAIRVANPAPRGTVHRLQLEPLEEMCLPSAYSAAVLADAPAVYYRLGDQSGGAAADLSGNGHNGTYVAGVIRGQQGALSGDPDTSAQFDGVRSLVDTSFRVSPGSFTIEAWVKPATSHSSPQQIVAGQSGSAQLVFDAYDENRRFFLPGHAGIAAFDGTRFYGAYTQGLLPLNSWTYLVGTWDEATEDMKIYVNGALDSTLHFSSESSIPGASTAAFQVGAFDESLHGGVYNDQDYQGSADEVAYYPRPLTPARILQHYEAATRVADIAPISLAWNTTQGGIDFGYTVTGADLTQPATAGLYWSADATFDPAADTAAYETPVEQTQGSHGPFFVSRSSLRAVPAGATHLILALDPGNQIAESNERNNEFAIAIPNIHVLAATTDDSRSVRISYVVEGAGVGEIPVRVYQSADENVSSDDLVYQTMVSAPGDLGDHTGANAFTVPLGEPLEINPSKPHILVYADPQDQIIETNDDPADNVQGFRKRVLGVVTHGYQPFGFISAGSPRWIQDMARELWVDEGYDRAFPFNWVRESSLPLPGQAVQAASRLAYRIESELQQMAALWPNDVIDIHLIGHSRGAVVLDQALVNPALLSNSDVIRGTVKVTMLDPHPAANYIGAQYYSVIPPTVHGLGQLGIIAEAGLLAFQAAADDPPLFRPPNADLVENFYQRTPALLTGSVLETILNLWGEGPFGWAANYELTRLGMSHTRVVDWYTNNILPDLGTGGTSSSAPGGGRSVAATASRPALWSAFPSDPIQFRQEVREFSRVLPRLLARNRSLGFGGPPAAGFVLRTMNSPGFWSGVREAAKNWQADELGGLA